ncbi:MAG: C-GCAxxG-C-C family protein [Acidaminococcales bacterium]|jgi:C_GCAxxG_C_C family probable redox protein|nr:C-GCAxxG-C-C family protein [Acidaminococcales bacterium]
MGTFVEKAAALSGEKYKKGINCAEAVVVTFDELCDLGIGENVRLASCFGGGIGHAGDLCGALSGSVMVLGALAGRRRPPEGERAPMYALSKGFYEKFTAVNNAADCDTLRKFDFGTREQNINCLKLVVATAALLAKYLVEKGLAAEN